MKENYLVLLIHEQGGSHEKNINYSNNFSYL